MDALLRISEALKHPDNENAIVIASHDLLRLTQYIVDLEHVMDEIQGANPKDFPWALPKPWEMFSQRLKERDSTADTQT